MRSNRAFKRLGAVVMAASCLVAIAGCAQSTGLTGSHWDYERQWAMALEGNKWAEGRISRALDSRRKMDVLRGLQGLSTRPEFVAVQPRAEQWLSDRVLPGWMDRFERAAVFADVEVRQDHSLIDPGRAAWSNGVAFTKRSLASTEQIDVPVVLSSPSTPMRNLARMKNGQAPLGPDNRPVQVCSLLMGGSPFYYEIRGADVSQILEMVAHPLPEEACMSPTEAGPYWRTRHRDYTNDRHEPLSPRPKKSRAVIIR